MNYAEAVMAFINDELADPDDEELTVDEDLLVTERVDSLGLMRLIAHIGSDMGIQVPYEDIVIENFRSVQAIHDYLTRQAASVDA